MSKQNTSLEVIIKKEYNNKFKTWSTTTSLVVNEQIMSLTTISRPYKSLVDNMTLDNVTILRLPAELIEYVTRDTASIKPAIQYLYDNKEYLQHFPSNIGNKVKQLVTGSYDTTLRNVGEVEEEEEAD